MEALNQYILAGRGLGDWLAALAWGFGGILVGKLVALFSRQVLRRISAKTKTRFDDLFFAVVERPLVFFLALAGLKVGIGLLQPDKAAADLVSHAWAVTIAFVAAWAIVRVLDAAVEAWLVPYVGKTEGTLDDQLLPILRKGGKALIWGLAVLIALRNAGYDVGALLAGLGIGGVAVALAAKDTLSNFFGSVAVFVDRPFRLHERIKVAGFDGTVVEIGLRTSRLKTLENRLVTIPNATFAANPIENVASEPSTRVVISLDIARESGSAGAERAVAAILAAAATVEGLDGGTQASLSGFSDWGLRLSYVIFIKKGADYHPSLNAANLAALRALEGAGVALAAPPRVLPG